MERYVIRGGRPGYERLAVLARAWLPWTQELLDRVGVGPGMRCLDLGCGGGAVSFELAGRVGATGSVTGVDMDVEKLELARQAAAELGVENVEFRVANVYDWDEPDSYDFVYCRLLLQHLSRPVDVLRPMWAAVRDGGAIGVEDSDFEGQFCHPPNEAFAFWVEAYQRVLRSYGGDPLTGRKLYALFAEAGIPAPELRVVQRVEIDGEAKLLPYLTVDAVGDALVTEGIATRDEVDVARDGLLALAQEQSTIMGSPRHFQAWSRRTPTTP